MNTSYITELEPHETVHAQPVHTTEHSLDRTLTEIRSGRRLEKIAASIQSFLESQFSRLESALIDVQSAEENDKILQRILADFEKEKRTWEEQRQAEILRLQNASEQLISGWQQLEDERRKWMDERDNPSTSPTKSEQ
jgi:hypothetical protein